jgi:hypothetical protein
MNDHDEPDPSADLSQALVKLQHRCHASQWNHHVLLMGRPVRVDAGAAGVLEARLLDPEDITDVAIEHHEARERHLADIETGGPLVRWPDGKG